jgi:parallel beta-helix repeat protein
MKFKILFLLLACSLCCFLDAAVFTVSNVKDSGSGSLRQAIMDSNSSPGLNHIVFNISGKGPFRIRPKRQLDPITNPVIIDAYTQTGSNQNTINNEIHANLFIEINGSQCVSKGPTGFGLTFFKGSDGSTIRGLVFNEWKKAGLLLKESSNHIVQGNFIGSDFKGKKAIGNKGQGLLLLASHNNTIQGNIISGNKLNGIVLSLSEKNLIQGNLIGTGVDNKSIPNGQNGIKLIASSNNLIGGSNRELGNVIAFNKQNGVEVGFSIIDDAMNNGILTNSIYKNRLLGINIHQDTIHDIVGPNHLQASPDISSVTTSAGVTTIEGTLSSLDDQVFLIQFFSTPSIGPGQGKTFLGQVTVQADTYGYAPFTFKTNAIGNEDFITATSTQLDLMETSQFSRPRR